MTEKTIICIGREYGSGGREIGEKLGKKLGIPCYDKVLLKQTAIDSGLAQSLFENADEKRTSWILNGFCSGNPTADAAMITSMDYLTNDSLFFMRAGRFRSWREKAPAFLSDAVRNRYCPTGMTCFPYLSTGIKRTGSNGL